MSRSTESFSQSHINMVARVAREAHARMMRGDMPTLHVYYQPMRIAAFADGEVPDGGWLLAFPESMPGDKTVTGLTAWLAYRADRIPYLHSDNH